MHNSTTINLKKELLNYGLDSHCIQLFDQDASPAFIDYLDLLPKSTQKYPEVQLDGVAESQGQPLLYFVNESRLGSVPAEKKQTILKLRRTLAYRGDRAYLARILPGELQVTPVNLFESAPEWKIYHAGTPEALTFFTRLAQGNYEGKGEPDQADYVFKKMYYILTTVGDKIAGQLDRPDILSLLGRTLFFRFLCDRKIISNEDLPQIAPQATQLKECFSDRENTYSTCMWLDRTFNGDFMPFTVAGNRKIFEKSFKYFYDISAIAGGFEEPAGDDCYQQELDLGQFDFAHVPVGLLSQVYEAFCWHWEQVTAKETSVHYTPRRIAATLIDEAFDGLPNAKHARILDPACGAGVFLVLAFRRLYREQWENTRPTRKVIRGILDNQLVGFDISDSALKLSALSLYLTALELDPKPVPLAELRFNKLNDRVLFNHRRSEVDNQEGLVIGSLGKHVDSRFDGTFDLVVSNPPWTSLPKDYRNLAAEFTETSKAIIRRKNECALAEQYENPNSTPDLPFLWKASEWCKPGGRIAMALPARILLKQEDIPRRARETIFQVLEVTGIINGSNLSDTEVWPKMAQPFMLLFARNKKPKKGHLAQFITPLYDKLLNGKGEMKIDSKSAQLIEVEQTFNDPWIWKALSIGTGLDIQVIHRISTVKKRLNDYWIKDLSLRSCTGFMIKPKQKQNDASYLIGLPVLTSSCQDRFLVNCDKLDRFELITACRPRELEDYKAPLLLVKVTSFSNTTEGRALISFSDVVFNESFYGYSAAGHHDGYFLTRYFHLLLHSSIWLYYTLLISPEFGAERRKIQKRDFDEFPIIPVDTITATARNKIIKLWESLIKGEKGVFSEIDTIFCSLYGLDDLDLEVIRDTLSVCLPYRESRERACGATQKEERKFFRKRLEDLLLPFFKILGKKLDVSIREPAKKFNSNREPFISICIKDFQKVIENEDEIYHKMIQKLAGDTGATRIVRSGKGYLVIGLVNQYRYWTPSRARLLAADIVQQHLHVFEG